MIEKIDSARRQYPKGDSRRAFAWHVREAIGVRLKIKKEHRHNDEES